MVILRPIFNRVIRRTLPMMALVIGTVHLALATCFYLVENIQPPMPVVASTYAVGLFCVGVWLLLKRWPLSIRLAHPMLFLLITLAASNSLFHLYASQEIWQTHFLVIVLIAASQFYLSLRWYLANISFIVFAWVVVAWGFMAVTPLYFSFVMMVGVAASIIMFAIRRDSHQQYELLRLKDAHRRAELRRRAQQMETLQEMAQALTSTLEWNEVLDLILARLSELVSYERGAVLVQRGHQLKFVAAHGFPTDSNPLSITVSLENENIFTRIVETKQPLSLEDAQNREDWKAVNSLPPTRSWLGVPLTLSGEVMGMLSLAREHYSPYTEDEILLAKVFARQAAIALKNAQQYAETTRFNQQMEYEVRQRTRAIQIAFEELEEMNRNKSDFIKVVSHELRTPLTILHGYAQMLMQDEAIFTDEMRRYLVEGIQTGSNRLSDIINSMLDVVKIDNRELDLYPAPVSVPALSRMVVDELETAVSDRHLSIDIGPMSDMPVIFADPDMLQKVFFHLLTNAIKYTPDGGSITIDAQQIVTDEFANGFGVEIVVADTGIGIDPEAQHRIFTKFYQTGEVSFHSSSKTQFKGGGPGLGLAIVKGIIEAHGGKIWVESLKHDDDMLPGSAFHIQLPISVPGQPDISSFYDPSIGISSIS